MPPTSPLPSRGGLFAALALALAALWVALDLGEAYVDRISNHDGYFLVRSEDHPPPLAQRPRAVFVLVDGLREDRARALSSLRPFLDAGQCATTEVGPPTVSRPVYTALASGVPQGRTGVRNNHTPRPAPVDTVFQAARRAGLRVSLTSGVAEWWVSLFPGGFSEAWRPPYEDNYLATAPLADLTLLHTLYVDEAGHHGGAASAAYADAVARTDRELGELLQRLDLSRDLLLISADHGHTDAGGHGGEEPELSRVLSCLAGAGLRPGSVPARLRIQSLGPMLALFLGLPLPAHLQANDGEDDLDALLGMLDPATYPATYREARRASVQAARAKNQEALADWLGPDEAPRWSRLEEVERRTQHYRAAASITFWLGLGAVLARVRGWRRVLTAGLYAGAVMGGAGLAYVWLRGASPSPRSTCGLNLWMPPSRVAASSRSGAGCCAWAWVGAARGPPSGTSLPPPRWRSGACWPTAGPMATRLGTRCRARGCSFIPSMARPSPRRSPWPAGGPRWCSQGAGSSTEDGPKRANALSFVQVLCPRRDRWREDQSSGGPLQYRTNA